MAEIGDDFPYIDVLKYSEAELDELLDTDLEKLLDKIESGFGESNLKETATAGEHLVQNDVITQQKLAGPVRQLETLEPQIQQEASQLRERLNQLKEENSKLQEELNRFKVIQMNPQKLLETLKEMEQHKQVHVSFRIET